ncbi:MAG: tail fiber domain-containing protein, partial [Bacteroidetes bacterium]|nr:tail fiber domain-containing protein [Bacteroidota bacterium]
GGQLGTIVSSNYYKNDIKSLGDDQVEDVVMNLRPVSFKYNGDDQHQHFGLIAEEVAEVVKDKPDLAELVVKRNDKPHTVGYHLLPTLLLKHVQKQQALLDSHAQEIAELKALLNTKTNA